MTGRRDATSWLGVAEEAIRLALADGAGQAEALITADDAALTRFANSEIHQNVSETNVQLNLRYVIGRRVGVASTGRLDADGLRAVAEAAGRIARNVEENDEFVSLPEPADPIPDLPAAFAMTMLTSTEAGNAYTFSEFSEMHRRAGFGNVTSQPVPMSPHTVVLAKREK